jgi:hypothetical protein
MRVKSDLARLRQIGGQEVILRFVLGGIITASAGAIATEFGPAVGGLFLAFPAILPASLTLVEKHENKKTSARMRGRRGRQAAAADATGAVLGSMGMIAFGFLVWQYASNYNPCIVLGCATGVWSIVTMGLWFIRKNWHRWIRTI